MTALSKKTCLFAAIALLALPASANAHPRVVPPGNSAVIQYTETFPTSGGNAMPGHHGKRSAAKVLGKRKAQRLVAAGPRGQAVAEVVAATAPAAVTATAPAHSSQPAPAPEKAAPAGSGDSGVGRVVSEATGSSDSGELGLLLPLLIVCALAGSTAYVLRHRRRTH